MPRRHSFEYVYNTFKNQGCHLLENIYKNNRTNMKYQCSCGNIDYITLDHFLRGHRCSECGMIKFKESMKHDYDYVKSVFDKKGFKLLSKYYVNNITPLEYECSCGNIWRVGLNSLSGISGCPNCFSRSKGEDKIVEYLNNINLKYERQYKFDDCKNINYLFFDFAIFYKDELLLLIEYQGQHHYYPFDYFGGKDKFKIRLKRDMIKTDYCINNNISLIKIPYWEFDNLEIYLERQLKNILIQKLRNQLLFYLQEKEVI